MKKNYPDVKADQYHVDGLTIQMVLNPDRFDVIVASNLFGDILSDLGPATAGTIGIAASGNINPSAPRRRSSSRCTARRPISRGGGSPIRSVHLVGRADARTPRASARRRRRGARHRARADRGPAHAGHEGQGEHFRSRRRPSLKRSDPVDSRRLKTYRIASIPGDGIGNEVIPAGIEVLNRVADGFALEFRHFDWSSKRYVETGRYIPEAGWKSCASSTPSSSARSAPRTCPITFRSGACACRSARASTSTPMCDRRGSCPV